MQSRLLIAFIILLLLIGGTILFFGITHKAAPATVATNSNGVSFPEATSTVSTGGSQTTSNSTQTVPLRDGSIATTNDFLHNGTTIEDPANAGTYYLAGSSGACTKDGSCPKAGDETDYTIVYYPSQNSFNIGLATEPLGPVRTEAEDYLMKTLGITQQQMCELTYYIGTTVYVNAQYAGKNLGFSFCPGATALPQ